MATVPLLALSRGTHGARSVAWLALLMLPLTVGCVTTSGMHLWHSDKHPPCDGNACQIVCTWQNSIAHVPDPTRGGEPQPGFVGRVYLFGQTIDFPVLAEGGLTVDLYDDSCQPPRMVERWNFDPVTLKQLIRKDMIGWGYTIFLPSAEYRPTMSKIRLRTSFNPSKGPAPIYTENAVTLSESNGVIRPGTTPLSFNGPRSAPTAPTSPTLPAPTPTLPTPTPKLTLPMPSQRK